MKYRRIDMIKILDAEIERRTRDVAEKNASESAAYHQKLQDFILELEPYWQEFCASVQGALAAKIPVMADVIPVGLMDRYKNIKFWNVSTPQPANAKVAELQLLRRALDAALDDEVSSSELLRMGFKVPNIFSRSA